MTRTQLALDGDRDNLACHVHAPLMLQCIHCLPAVHRQRMQRRVMPECQLGQPCPTDVLCLQDPIGKQNASASFGAKFAPATPGLPAYFAKGGANSAVTQSASVLSYRCRPLAPDAPSACLFSHAMVPCCMLRLAGAPASACLRQHVTGMILIALANTARLYASVQFSCEDMQECRCTPCNRVLSASRHGLCIS